ncbi:MAG: hypothetical protein JNM84_13195 [Planctomycetes bacterium]|nr:hypothetical protein [Planctomycetota bacterium]
MTRAGQALIYSGRVSALLHLVSASRTNIDMMLWFDRATVNGVPVSGISTIVSAGLVDSMCLFRTRIPYRPSMLLFRLGDSFVFEGFTFGAGTLGRTGPVEMTWR